MNKATKAFNVLVNDGFQPITTWLECNGSIKLASLNWSDAGGWIYAFVIDKAVKYVGLTDRVLRSRMDDYRHIKEEQCVRMREQILAELQAGHVVTIYGKPTSDKERLIADEDRYRRELLPPWNRC
jgi:hypothetical protein